LTKGESGAVLLSRGEWSQLPSLAVQIADTVGAGDAYTAAMVLGLLSGNDVESINRKAIEVASFVCTQSGATMPFPFRFNDRK
jgi:fructokinase